MSAVTDRLVFVLRHHGEGTFSEAVRVPACPVSGAFLPARRYGSAGTSYGPVSVSVCLSQVGVLSKWMDRSSWFVACVLLSTYPTLCYKEIQVCTKIRVLPSATLSQTPDSGNFASAYRLSKRIIDLAGERWTLRA